MELLSGQDFENIKASGQILKNALNLVSAAVKPGVSTAYLNEIGEKAIFDAGAEPSFKDYFVEGSGIYPAGVCVSVNDEIVHGLPKDRILLTGDIVSLDLGVQYHGMCTDMAVTLPVGRVSSQAELLINVTKKALDEALASVKIGGHIGDIGATVEGIALANDLGVIKALVGHGVGSKPHLPPQIPNFGKKGTGPEIVEGMALAIEPMLTLGDFRIQQLADGWTIATIDGSLAAHFEHTIIIENGQTVIVTK